VAGDFYFGRTARGLRDQLARNLDTIDAGAVNAVPIGRPATARRSWPDRASTALPEEGEETVSIPETWRRRAHGGEAEELLAAPSSDRVLAPTPRRDSTSSQGRPVRPYVQLVS